MIRAELAIRNAHGISVQGIRWEGKRNKKQSEMQDLRRQFVRQTAFPCGSPESGWGRFVAGRVIFRMT